MKMILLLIGLFTSLSTLKAQSAEETLEWLKVKKDEIYTYQSHSCNFPSYQDKVINFSTTAIIFKKGDYDVQGYWKYIKEVKEDRDYIRIVYDWNCAADPLYQAIHLPSDEVRKKFIRALKHMATLKGAKLIDSDLF